MVEKEIIERLMWKAEQVRKAQHNYFKNRTDINKKISMGLESSLDDYLKQLRKLGYNPDNQKEISSTQQMF